MLTPSKSCRLSAVADVRILANSTLKFINKIRPQLDGHDIFGSKETGYFEIISEADFEVNVRKKVLN
jgi:hypothetical protein